MATWTLVGAACLVLASVGAVPTPLPYGEGPPEDAFGDLFTPMPSEELGPAPIPQGYMAKQMSMTDQWDYLKMYGYVAPADMNAQVATYTDMSGAIRALQRSAGLPETGEMDTATSDTMRLPRCGMRDDAWRTTRTRRRRYALAGSKFSGRDLTYNIVQYSNNPQNEVSVAQTDSVMERALQYWAHVSPLRFHRRAKNQKVDIEIKFAAGAHNDQSPFDGSGGTLAHAYFPGPGIGGDGHFDDDERFTEKKAQGINLLQVATHEFGHSLGLGHSNNQRAVMAPFYRGYQPGFSLHSDDVMGIQAIYGSPVMIPLTPRPVTQRPVTQRPVTQRPATRRPVTLRPVTLRPVTQRPATQRPVTQRPTPLPPSGCRVQFDAVISGVTRSDRKFTFAFRGTDYYNVDATDGCFSCAKSIVSDFHKTRSVDAAIATTSRSYQNGINIFLFKGSYVDYYIMLIGDDDSFRFYFRRNLNVGDVVSGLPNDIDAIFLWRGNGKIYAFKGDQYYRLDGNRVAGGYPRALSVWGLPPQVQRVDAVVTYAVTGRTYFFSGTEYYRFSKRGLTVDPGYPRDVGRWWLGCRADSLVLDGTAREEGGAGLFNTVPSVMQSDDSAAPTACHSMLMLAVMVLTALV